MTIVKIWADDTLIQEQAVLPNDPQNDNFTFVLRPAPGCHYLSTTIKIQIVEKSENNTGQGGVSTL